jgi:hypothetical protein
MKRTLIAVMLALALVLIPAGSAFAAKDDTVTITMTGGNLSIDVTPNTTYEFGMVVQDEFYSTMPSEDAQFTVTNDGTVQADIDIHGADTTITGAGTTWALQANPGTPDIYALDFQRHEDLGIWHEFTTADAPYMYDLDAAANDTFGLRLWTPVTITDTASEQTAIITLTASQSLAVGLG